MLEAKGLINFGRAGLEDIHYNCGESMHSLIVFGVRLLEVLFAAGVAGSALVLVATGIEDLQTILESSHRLTN